jgi:hypothetical protein
MPGGRPTTCTDDITQAAWDYANGGWEKVGHAFPSVVGLCDVLNTAKSTVYDWSNTEGFEFSDILAAIKSKQELVAFNRSITGEYNATIAKLLLGKHGYHDKQDNNNTNTELTHEQWLESLKDE